MKKEDNEEKCGELMKQINISPRWWKNILRGKNCTQDDACFLRKNRM